MIYNFFDTRLCLFIIRQHNASEYARNEKLLRSFEESCLTEMLSFCPFTEDLLFFDRKLSPSKQSPVYPRHNLQNNLSNTFHRNYFPQSERKVTCEDFGPEITKKTCSQYRKRCSIGTLYSTN